MSFPPWGFRKVSKFPLASATHDQRTRCSLPAPAAPSKCPGCTKQGCVLYISIIGTMEQGGFSLLKFTLENAVLLQKHVTHPGKWPLTPRGPSLNEERVLTVHGGSWSCSYPSASTQQANTLNPASFGTELALLHTKQCFMALVMLQLLCMVVAVKFISYLWVNVHQLIRYLFLRW